MTEKPVIGGKPTYDNPFSHCTFLGRFAGHDLYFMSPPDGKPDVLARSGDEVGDYVEGLALSYGANTALTAARRVAEFKGLYKLNLLDAMLRAHEAPDLALLKTRLPSTYEYQALKATADGDTVRADEHVSILLSPPFLFERYPDSPVERLRHLDTCLYVLERFTADTFPPGTSAQTTKSWFLALNEPAIRKF